MFGEQILKKIGSTIKETQKLLTTKSREGLGKFSINVPKNFKQIEDNAAKLENGYKRAVTFEGNSKARSAMNAVFETTDAAWHGLGNIPLSGLKLRKEFEAFDAQKVLNIKLDESEDPKGCACGKILLGLKIPPQCPLYKTACTPMHPVGPCMVSSEGTCAAYHRYHDT